jgi:hypothetical protein
MGVRQPMIETGGVSVKSVLRWLSRFGTLAVVLLAAGAHWKP